MAGSVPDGAPGMDALVSNATANQTWSDAKDFELTHISLNGGLQMGGNPFPDWTRSRQPHRRGERAAGPEPSRSYRSIGPAPGPWC
ncbi:TULIP family P47-like protein [Streptomyces sp. NPDC057257]|uniref:TULIP family P47-like protein n=1 Tax=Streptomyces sp. NPDC057257 TaxID=3346071 RepID=UPI003635F486